MSGFDIRYRRLKTKFGSSCHYIVATEEKPDDYGFCHCAYYKTEYKGKQYGQHVIGPVEKRSISEGPSKEMMETLPKFVAQTKQALRYACFDTLRLLRKSK